MSVLQGETKDKRFRLYVVRVHFVKWLANLTWKEANDLTKVTCQMDLYAGADGRFEMNIRG